MNDNQAIRSRIRELVDRGNWLKIGDDNGRVVDDSQYQECKGWITAVQHIVSLLFPYDESFYKQHIDEIAGTDYEWRVNHAVGETTAILSNLIVDLEKGLLNTIANQTRVEIFDSFLDHARIYLQEEMKDQAGVIAGVVFEDTVRRIARSREIDEAGVDLDQLISKLGRIGVLSGAMAKRARAAAHVRTKATHAQWGEFSASDVEAAIALTDELVLRNIDGTT